jgi:hypothetical protein
MENAPIPTSCDDDHEDDDDLLRQLTPCEEDRRRLFPATKWTGGYRWFRSPNVSDLEAYRRRMRGAGCKGHVEQERHSGQQ